MRRVEVVSHPVHKFPAPGMLPGGLVTGGGQHPLRAEDDEIEEVRFAPGVGAVPANCTSVEIDNVWIAWGHDGASRMNQLEADGWVLRPIAPGVASVEGSIFRATRMLDADGKVIGDGIISSSRFPA